MKKGLLIAVGLLSLPVVSLYATTSYFRTPLSFIESRWGYVHYPFAWLDDCANWEIDAMGVAYERSACRAYGKNPACINNDDECNSSCNNNNKVTRDTVSLSQLWFGKESFLASEIFAGGIASGSSVNPFLNFVRITPNFDYNENGAALALNAVRKNLGCDKSWFVGGRIALPISVIEVNQRNAGSIAVVIPGELANTVITMEQQYAGKTDGTAETAGSTDSRIVKAYRLDFLSSLKLPDGTAMVRYGTVGDATTDTFIAGQDITTNMDQYLVASGSDRAPIYAYKQSSGVFPIAVPGLNKDSNGPAGTGALFPVNIAGNAVYPLIDDEANVILNAAGNNSSDGQWGAFGGFNSAPGLVNLQEDYAGGLGLDVATQKQLFIVPVAASSSQSFENVGLLVQNTIDQVLASLQTQGSPDVSVIQFFADRGILFESSDCSTGAGDTFLEFYGGKMRDCWFADGLFGLRLPTGSDADDPRRIYEQTTGNNGHFATKLGAEGGYVPCSWFGMKFDFFWSHNFSHTEKRAVPFKGSTVRNIGPCIDAKVHWDDFQAHADFTFFSPRCPDLGWDFGYEFYAKTDDKLCLCATQAIDFNGNTQFVDASILSEDTNTQSHKLRAEIFNRWGCFELFFGGSYIIAGRQVMKEAECHLGMKAYF